MILHSTSGREVSATRTVGPIDAATIRPTGRDDSNAGESRKSAVGRQLKWYMSDISQLRSILLADEDCCTDAAASLTSKVRAGVKPAARGLLVVAKSHALNGAGDDLDVRRSTYGCRVVRQAFFDFRPVASVHRLG